MGDVVVRLAVESSHRARARTLPLCFDTGTATTFVRADVAKRLGYAMDLPDPEVFYGLGNGRFVARQVIRLLVRIKGVWCMQPAFVVSQDALEEGVLVGHDFMQKFYIRVGSRGHRIVVRVEDLRRGQRAY